MWRVGKLTRSVSRCRIEYIYEVPENRSSKPDLCFLNFNWTDRQREMKRQTERDRQNKTGRQTERNI